MTWDWRPSGCPLAPRDFRRSLWACPELTELLKSLLGPPQFLPKMNPLRFQQSRLEGLTKFDKRFQFPATQKNGIRIQPVSIRAETPPRSGRTTAGERRASTWHAEAWMQNRLIKICKHWCQDECNLKLNSMGSELLK